METPSPSGALITKPTSRRTLVKGVAWSVPAISLAAAAPAFAASPTPLINGFFNTGGICNDEGVGNPTGQITLNTIGASRGLWVLYARPSVIEDGATVTLFVPTSVNGVPVPASLGFDGGGGGWSALTPDPTPPGGALAGHNAWTTTYTGAWTEAVGSPDAVALPDVTFYSEAAATVQFTSDTFENDPNNFCSPAPVITVRRRVTVRGKLLTQQRTGAIGGGVITP